jgi:hypothetical protein
MLMRAFLINNKKTIIKCQTNTFSEYALCLILT